MIDGSVRQRFLVFLAVVGCLGVSLQTVKQPSCTEPITGALRFAGTSLTAGPASPSETEGEMPSSEKDSSVDWAVVVHAPPAAALPRERRLLAADRTACPEGFPAEIERPPTGAA